MTPHLASLAVLVPVMGLLVWRRVRSQFGRQPIRRGRMLVRIAIFALLGVLMALFGLRHPPLLEGLLGGVVMGIVLGMVGLRLTRFERRADGGDGYIPNPWIGAVLTALLVGRLAWRFAVVMPQMATVEPGVPGAPALGYSPLTMLVFGLLVGYYVAYFSGLLVHHRRFERAQAAPVIVDTLSTIPLDRQVGTDGATWLDRELIADRPEPLRDAGFGREARDALARRRQWLIEQDLAREDENGRTVYRANLLAQLRRRDLARAAGQLSDELGLVYAEAKAGERIEGTYRRAIDLASGRFAVVERAKDFTLVPWRPVLERSVGKAVSGIARDEGISWTLGRQRKGPEIY